MAENKIEFDKFSKEVIVKAYGPSNSSAVVKNNEVKITDSSSLPTFGTYSVIKPQQSGNNVNGKTS